MARDEPARVVVVGGGVAGLTAGTYTARAGLETVVVNSGESLLRRNAHLENVPGFPAGVDARLFVDLLQKQAERNGCLLETGDVTEVRRTEDGFEVSIDGDETENSLLYAPYVIVASWGDTTHLEGMDAVGFVERGSKSYVQIDDQGRTGVEGLYAAGRVAGKPHQTVVCAGHGAEVALTLVEDSEIPFYHDWVVPEGYFTERGREVPPGCEEIDEAERRRRARESIAYMADAFEEQDPGEPTMHPSVVETRTED